MYTAANYIDEFEQARPRLTGLAYRILGSVSEAEDAVQETSIKWLAADKDKLQNSQAWLTTVCTRHCLDVLKSAHKTRTDYFGTWLPEPVVTQSGEIGEGAGELASSLSTAFLLLLERLSPKERAAYLLYELFECSYVEVAATLDMTEAACRKLVSRARKNISADKCRYVSSSESQEKLLQAFEQAIGTGDVSKFGTLLAEDAELGADGGGKVIALEHVLMGKKKILGFIGKVLSRSWREDLVTRIELNGSVSLLYRNDDGINATVSFELNEKVQVQRIFIVRNPEKLAALDSGVIALC